jgi:hypothetical protein
VPELTTALDTASMSTNFTAILAGEGSGTVIFNAFLLPILYVCIALLTVTGEAIYKKYFAKRCCGKKRTAKATVRKKNLQRVYSVEQSRAQVFDEALKRGAQLEFFSTLRTFETFCSLTSKTMTPSATREHRTVWFSFRLALAGALALQHARM